MFSWSNKEFDKKVDQTNQLTELRNSYNEESNRQDEDVFLKDINLYFGMNRFYAIIGRVGSGKSSLISCIVDQMNLVSGQVYKNGSISIISQDPLLLNDTLENNILFGKKLDEKKYQKIISIC